MQVDEETRKATGITDRQYINQFPFESCLVMKHYLADIVQKAFGLPEWIQPTYNLETHLAQLIGDYTVRKRDGQDNLWILKPWNMTYGDRSKDMSEVHRASCLIQGKEVDLRYVVLVRQIHPLELFLSDVFWVRLTNNQYSVDERTLFEYETHFTVMNYIGKLNHMNTPDFVKEFEKEHNVIWSDIHQNIKKMIRAVFESAAMVHPEMHSPMSRAMYGVDVMLDSSFKPKLLEYLMIQMPKDTIYAELEGLIRSLKKIGYVPEISLALQDMEEEHKQEFLFVMESTEDPAYEAVCMMLENFNDDIETHIVVAGLSTTCRQKIHNQLVCWRSHRTQRWWIL